MAEETKKKKKPNWIKVGVRSFIAVCGVTALALEGRKINSQKNIISEQRGKISVLEAENRRLIRENAASHYYHGKAVAAASINNQ